MPHIRIEVSAKLAMALDWSQLTSDIHNDLADAGWAALTDLKTRVLTCADAFAGVDKDALQLVATLIITNPRTAEVQTAMKDRVLHHLRTAVQDLQLEQWVQCCVFIQATSKQDYAKWQLNPPLMPLD